MDFCIWSCVLRPNLIPFIILLASPLEKAMAIYSSTLAWRIPWTEEPGRLQTMGSWRVRHDWATSLSLFTFMHWRRKQQPTPVFLPGESQGRGAWWAAIYGVAESQTRLKQLSSSSSISIFYGCWNKAPQTWWLKTTDIYCLTVLKARVQNQGVSRPMLPLKYLEGDPFCSLPASGSPVFPGFC